MTRCDDKTWIEHPPGSRGRVDALVLAAIRLGYGSITAIAHYSGVTYDEAEAALKRLHEAGRVSELQYRRLYRLPARRLPGPGHHSQEAL